MTDSIARSPVVGDVQFPQIIGFDLPARDAADPAAVMAALLDVAPSPEWATAFSAEVEQFRLGRAFSSIRVVGSTITVMGQLGDMRRLGAELKALVHRVSRLTLQQRVLRSSAESWDDSQTTMVVPHDPADPELRRDLARVAGIAAIPTLLEAVAQATGMRFVAVARVTEQRWTACAVYDRIQFGLLPGQDLVLETTICNEIRQHGHTVTFDCASTDPRFCTHPTPARYGFESYISVPIHCGDGAFFGTLCALDPEPARLDATTIATLEWFAQAIGRQLATPEAVVAA